MRNNETMAPRLRNARACELCRASKSKCLFKSADVCQRCTNTGGICYVREKARPGRARPSTTNAPTSGLQDGIKSSSNSDKGAQSILMRLPAVFAPDLYNEREDLQKYHEHFLKVEESLEKLEEATEELSTQVIMGLWCDPLSVNVHKTLPQSRVVQSATPKELSLAHAEMLFSRFLSKKSFFNFISLPPKTTVKSMSRNSPFLLLAILTSSSSEEPLLSRQLDQEFKRILSEKVILGGQRSLDLLQGILAYVAWCPIQSRTSHKQAFLFLDLAMNIIEALGLHQESPDIYRFTPPTTDSHIEGANFSKAAKRAYLGCYLLKSRLSFGFFKPHNSLSWTALDAHFQSLAQDEDFHDALSLVRLQLIEERIDARLSSVARNEDDILAAQQEFENWKLYTSKQTRDKVHIALLERAFTVTMYSHKLQLLSRFVSPTSPERSQDDLEKCLAATKVFFEYLLSIAGFNLNLFTVIHWGGVVEAILILSRLTFSMAAQMGWDADTTRAKIPLVIYLDCLSFRSWQLSSTASKESLLETPDCLHLFALILGSVKKSYERRVSNIKVEQKADKVTATSIKSNCPMNDPILCDFLELDASGYGGLPYDPDASTVPDGSSQTPPFYHDVWATMTGSWAKET